MTRMFKRGIHFSFINFPSRIALQKINTDSRSHYLNENPTGVNPENPVQPYNSYIRAPGSYEVTWNPISVWPITWKGRNILACVFLFLSNMHLFSYLKNFTSFPFPPLIILVPSSWDQLYYRQPFFLHQCQTHF